MANKKLKKIQDASVEKKDKGIYFSNIGNKNNKKSV